MRNLNNLMVLSRVENTSITPKVFNIYLRCAAKQCNTPTANGSRDRYKGRKKCSRCPACDMYIIIDSRDNGKLVKKCKYTQDNYEKLFNSILDGTVHGFLFISKQEGKQ